MNDTEQQMRENVRMGKYQLHLYGIRERDRQRKIRQNSINRNSSHHN
jgi:hypothetical protein